MAGGKQRKREATAADVSLIRDGVHYLQSAIKDFKMAGANNAVIAVRKALKSAQGALRHADLMVTVGNQNRAKKPDSHDGGVGSGHLDA